MKENYKKQPDAQRDYKERFEFRLTVGENIICQRYFKISNFNPASLKSLDLAETIRYCGDTIDKVLKEKSAIYLDICAPHVFNNVDEMNKFYENEDNRKRMRPGHGIVVKSSLHDYVWGGNGKPVSAGSKFSDSDYSSPLTAEDCVDYKFSFLVDDVEVCSYVWTGIYPKYIRHSIDLSNKNGRVRPEDAGRLSFEQYVDYRLVEGRNDMVWGLISHICDVCSYPKTSDYVTGYRHGSKFYDNFDNFSDSFYVKERK